MSILLTEPQLEQQTKSYRSLPGPGFSFVYGSIFRNSNNRITFMEEMTLRYGSMIRFSAFNENCLLLSDAEMIEEVLIEKQSSFRKGRGLEQAKLFLGNSVLVSEGAEHHRQRKLLQPAFHRSRIAGYAHTMAQCADKWVQARLSGEKLDMSVEMNRLTLEIVSATLFGSGIEGHSKEVTDSLHILMENFNRLVMPFASFIRMAPTAKNRQILAAETNLNKAVYAMIQERRKAGVDRGDLLSMLINAEDAQSDHPRLSDQEIRDQAMTLFLAGHETTANALAWTWHLLAQPGAVEVRTRLREEITQTLGDRLPTLEDVGKLPYTRAVLSEAMRIFPPAWMVGRRAIRPVTIGGVEIPARTIVLCSTILVHRSPQYWENPLVFNPERWLKKEAPERPKCAYFPFGAGARVCMGEAFAWTEGIILLASLARRWNFDYCGPQATPRTSVTLRTRNGMPMQVRN